MDINIKSRETFFKLFLWKKLKNSFFAYYSFIILNIIVLVIKKIDVRSEKERKSLMTFLLKNNIF